MSSDDRSAERRHSERRRSRRAAGSDASWFGASGTERDGRALDDALRDADMPIPSQALNGGAAEGDAFDTHLGDSRFMSRHAGAGVGEDPGPTAFERIYRAFIAARAALGRARGGCSGCGPRWP